MTDVRHELIQAEVFAPREWSLRDEHAEVATEWSTGLCVGLGALFIFVAKSHMFAVVTLLIVWAPTLILAVAVAALCHVARTLGYLAPQSAKPKKVRPTTFRQAPPIEQAAEPAQVFDETVLCLHETERVPSVKPKAPRTSGTLKLSAGGKIRFWVPNGRDIGRT